MTRVRLQKYLAACGEGSRRAAEKLIAAGQVMVNGKRVTAMGVKIDPAVDQVRVGRRFIRPQDRGVILFHKPRGVVSTRRDPEGRPTIAAYLPARFRGYFPVGRLDYDSSGLMVLTNDGDLAAWLLHPRFGMRRVYEARVFGRVSEETQARLAKGIRLHDGVAAAEVGLMRREGDHTWLRITVEEGRNRLVRRLLEAVGHPVGKLKRVAHGPFKLGALKSGEIRRLGEKEYQALRARIAAAVSKAVPRKRRKGEKV